jgi:hypothetical protein
MQSYCGSKPGALDNCVVTPTPETAKRQGPPVKWDGNPWAESDRLEHNRRAPQEHWAEVLTLEEMLLRFVLVSKGKRVLDLMDLGKPRRFSEFKGVYMSSRTLVATGRYNPNGTPKTRIVETTQLWEQSPARLEIPEVRHAS